MRRWQGDLGIGSLPTICLAIAVVMTSLTTLTARGNDGIASDAVIDRAGLTIDWFTHSGAGATSQLVDWQLVINENKATTFFTISAGSYRETFSEKNISPFGKPFGMDGAVAFASIRKEVLEAELKSDGIDQEVKVSQYALPESTIYMMMNSGLVKALDADTGKLRWQTFVGNGNQPSIGLGANNDYVAALNGSSVYCLEASTGKVLWNRKCQYAVSASPNVSEEKIYVPLVNGRLETFSIEDKGINSRTFVSSGAGMARPLITSKTVSWPTDRGDMNVAARYGNYRGVSYQLNADSAIVSSPVFRDDHIFVSSMDGFVYSVNEDRGSINWQVSTGAAISQSPFPLGENLFVINDLQELYKLKIADGANAEGWEKPRTEVARFLGASKKNLYVIDKFGNLKVLSQGSGTTLSSVQIGRVDKILPNFESDRIYVANRGMIQCIRETSRPIPLFHLNDEFGPVEVESSASDAGQEGGRGRAKAKSDLEDPFKTMDDEDPFKSGDSGNPFDQKPLDKENDPFAGEDSGNPFGGSNNSKKPAESKSTGSGDDDDPFK